MELLPARVPITALFNFTSLFVPTNVPSGSIVELSIVIENRDLSVRGLGGYLSLLDRVYGRLTEMGLRSYSQTPYKQLRLAEVRAGSIEFIISEVISHFHEAVPLAILYLFLKYLPGTVKAISDTAKNSVETWKTAEEALLTRLNRKRLKEEMNRDLSLKNLTAKRLNQLVKLLDELEAVESKKLAAPVRFAETAVKEIEITVREKKDSI